MNFLFCNTNPDMQTYYLPRECLSPQAKLVETAKKSLCEWKGLATYWAITDPNGSEVIMDRIWSYESPTPRFSCIKSYLSFYAGPWTCFVDGEQVTPQPGDFYGGWMTSDIEGKVKGPPGTMFW